MKAGTHQFTGVTDRAMRTRRLLTRALATGPLVCAVATSCATVIEELPPQPTGVIIEGFKISNELPYPVTDVMLIVPSTGAFAGCGNLSPKSACSSSFESADYYANPVKISWREHGQQHETSEFVVRIPEHMGAGDIAWVEAVIFAPGQAGAKLVSSTP